MACRVGRRGRRYADPGAWRTFTVGGVPTATTPPGINGTGVFDTTLVAVAPTWSTPDVTNTYQWRRNGSPVEGATGPAYVVRAEDVGASITVVVTGTSAEFGTGTSTSAAVTGKAGAGALVTTSPTISGTGKVATTLTSTPVAWDPAETEHDAPVDAQRDRDLWRHVDDLHRRAG